MVAPFALYKNGRHCMTDKELRRLHRSELLEMLISLTEENRKLNDLLEQTRSQLRDRQITIENAGSLAEAALSLSGIFQTADAAAQQYLESVRKLTAQQEEACRAILSQAEQKAAETKQEALSYSQKVYAEANADLVKSLSNTTAEA